MLGKVPATEGRGRLDRSGIALDHGDGLEEHALLHDLRFQVVALLHIQRSPHFGGERELRHPAHPTHLTKTEIQHIPYRGLSQAVNDLLSGPDRYDVRSGRLRESTILSGGVKPIAVTVPTRSATIPKVPSSSEAGLPQLRTVAWTALF